MTVALAFRPAFAGLKVGATTKRQARVLPCLYRDHLVALHGFIKKTRKTPEQDWALAHKRQKELEE